jgi:hypothetical protein
MLTAQMQSDGKKKQSMHIVYSMSAKAVATIAMLIKQYDPTSTAYDTTTVYTIATLIMRRHTNTQTT